MMLVILDNQHRASQPVDSLRIRAVLLEAAHKGYPLCTRLSLFRGPSYPIPTHVLLALTAGYPSRT